MQVSTFIDCDVSNWKKNLDKEGKCGALFVDLSKVLDCLQRDLILAKLNAYGFGYKSLQLISSFLSNRKYRTKINSSLANRNISLLAFPRDLSWVLYYLTYTCVIFLVFMAESNVANYADDTALYVYEKIVRCGSICV